MPLTRKGKSAKRVFISEYGSRGKNIFYAYMKKHKKRTKNWH